MFHKSYLLSLFVSAVAAGSQIVPGAFIIEYEDVKQPPLSLGIAGAVKIMDLDFESFKGATIQLEASKPLHEHVAQLLALPTIKNVWPKKIISPPDVQVKWVASHEQASDQLVKRSNNSDAYSTHIQTQVDKLRAEGITGKGVKIAVVDTGIDYTHPALGGCFGTNCLVVGGHDFVGDNYNGTNTPFPDDDPMDCNGHGTHVAGIMAAQKNNFGFTGAAPDVKLTAYRTYGCNGTSSNDVIIAAFLRAQQDGAHIISASLGTASGWSDDAMGAVATRIVAKGVIFVAAAGNSGKDGLFMASSPSGAKGVAGIASYDNSVWPFLSYQGHYAVSGSSKQSFDYVPGNPGNWTNVNLSLWTPSFDVNQTDQGCSPFPDDTPDLSDKIVLIRRGTCYFDDKAKNAAARGAKYIMFYNNVPGTIYVWVLPGPNVTAIGVVSATQGETWVRDLAAGKVVTLDMGHTNNGPVKIGNDLNNDTGGFLSSYTSWGPSFEADIVPTFGAPGGLILSTYPVAKGSYAVLSGTSMAAPLTSAIYALVANVRKTFDPAELRNVLAATAKPVQANLNGNIRPWLAPTAQQGAGMVQAYDAAYATTVLSESYLAFNQTALLSDKNFAISNTGHEEVTYELDVIGAATAYTFSNSSKPDPFPGLELDGSFATVHLSNYKVTVPAGGKSNIDVKVTPPSIAAARLPIYGGYIRINGTNGERLSLPYQGILGDLNAHTVLNTTYMSQTWNNPKFDPVFGSNATFLLPHVNITNITDADNFPIVVVDMFLGSPLIKIDVLKTGNDTTNLGPIINSPYRYNPRGQVPFVWNGQLADRSWALAGTYKFRVSALHILGDEKDQHQYDVSESPSFTIKYKESK